MRLSTVEPERRGRVSPATQIRRRPGMLPFYSSGDSTRTTIRPLCFSADTVTPPGRASFLRSRRWGEWRWTLRLGGRRWISGFDIGASTRRFRAGCSEKRRAARDRPGRRVGGPGNESLPIPYTPRASSSDLRLTCRPCRAERQLQLPLVGIYRQRRPSLVGQSRHSLEFLEHRKP